MEINFQEWLKEQRTKLYNFKEYIHNVDNLGHIIEHDPEFLYDAKWLYSTFSTRTANALKAEGMIDREELKKFLKKNGSKKDLLRVPGIGESSAADIYYHLGINDPDLDIRNISKQKQNNQVANWLREFDPDKFNEILDSIVD